MDKVSFLDELQDRLAALMGSGGDTDEARDVSEAETAAEYVETEVAS